MIVVENSIPIKDVVYTFLLGKLALPSDEQNLARFVLWTGLDLRVSTQNKVLWLGERRKETS